MGLPLRPKKIPEALRKDLEALACLNKAMRDPITAARMRMLFRQFLCDEIKADRLVTCTTRNSGAGARGGGGGGLVEVRLLCCWANLRHHWLTGKANRDT